MDKRDTIFEEDLAGTDLPPPMSTSNGANNEDSANEDAAVVAAADDTIADSSSVPAAQPPSTLAAPRAGQLELFDDVDFGPPLPFAMMAASGAVENARPPPSSLVEIEDDVGPSLPFAMTAAASGAVEKDGDVAGQPSAGLVQIEDDIGPPLPLAMIDDDKKPAAKDIDLEIDHNHDGPPVPFRFASFDGCDDLQKKKAMRVEGKGSTVPLVSNQTTSGAPQSSNDVAPHDHVGDLVEDDDGITLPQEDGVEDYGISTSTVPFDAFENMEEQTYPSNNVNATPPTVERETSVIHIPEAFRVEEEDDHFIIDGHAEPLLPWWKQRRTKLLLSIIFFMFIAAVIAIGVSYSLDRTKMVNLTSSPTASAVPTVEQSSPPSLSLAPSSSPSECAIKISNKVQELKLLIDTPINTKFAMDGRNAVVVAQDPNAQSVYVMFYSLEDDVWESVNPFVEYVDNIRDVDVALSGSTALVGVEISKPECDNCLGESHQAIIYVYEQDSRGLWTKGKGKEPSVPAFRWADNEISVDIDGEFAIVCDHYEGNVYIFRRNEVNWIQIREITAPYANTSVLMGGRLIDSCSIANNFIAIDGSWGTVQADALLYEYDSYIDRFVPLHQDSHLMPSYDYYYCEPKYRVKSLSKDYLVMAARGNGSTRFFIYHRQDSDQSFSLLQSFNSSGYGDDFGRNWAIEEDFNSSGYSDDYFDSSDYSDDFGRILTIEKDVMIVSGSNQTYIFSLQQNGLFKEAATLNESYDGYQISGRNIIAEKNNTVYTFSIEDCFPMPTTSPSLSPSLIPSSVPSQSQSPTASSRPSTVEQMMAYQEAEERYKPLWFEQTTRAGTSYVDAIEFCAAEDYAMCHYEAICPLGPGSEPLGGVKGAQKSWVPVANRINEWAQVGSQSPCVKQYPSEHHESSEQSQSGFGKEDVTHHIACCIVPEALSESPNTPIPCYNIELNGTDVLPAIDSLNWYIFRIYPHKEVHRGLCLPEGFYKVHITIGHKGMFSSFGHSGVRNCDNTLDYVEISLDGQIVALEFGSASKGYEYKRAISNAYVSCEAVAIFSIPFDQIPSNPPSQSSSTLSPTVSPIALQYPTNECFWVEITIVDPLFLHESSWDLEQISATGDNVMVKSYKATWGNSSHKESLCLKKGQYQFTIYDSYGDGIYIYVLSTYGEDIVRRGAFGTSETTTFNIPFDPKANPTWSPTTTLPTWSPTTITTWSPTTITTWSPTSIPTYSTTSPTITPRPTWSPTTITTWLPASNTLFPTFSPTSQASPSTPIEVTTPESSTPPSTSPQTQQPSTPIIITNVTCATQAECDKQRQKLEFANFYPGNYADYGCFSKNGISYWGMGGTDEQISIDPLGGLKERIWCEEIL